MVDMQSLRQRVFSGQYGNEVTFEYIELIEDRVRELEAELRIVEADHAVAYQAWQAATEETARKEDDDN